MGEERVQTGSGRRQSLAFRKGRDNFSMKVALSNNVDNVPVEEHTSKNMRTAEIGFDGFKIKDTRLGG